MKSRNKKGFTLVELLVVITILSIISVVAYQSFWGATDKAISGRKINDILTIETSLQQFKVDKNYYPMPMIHSTTNLWWYNSGVTATPSNTLSVTYAWQEITAVNSGAGWGIIYGSGLNAANQIGAKWVIGYTDVFGKSYLSKELYDPELGDIAVGSAKMIDSGIGRYTYAVYAQPRPANLWNRNQNSATYYNIATTLKQKDSETYETYIVGDYDNNACTDKTTCPETLIGSGTTFLKNKQTQDLTQASNAVNQGIPYPIKDL